MPLPQVGRETFLSFFILVIAFFLGIAFTRYNYKHTGVQVLTTVQARKLLRQSQRLQQHYTKQDQLDYIEEE